jgi:2-polyprenyl-6-methoxyphenol hydroxylase-like FAD-dependent oxidoreductase
MVHLDVAIVGCGVAGMAAALFLSRGGHRVHLFERFAAPRPLGSGLLLQPTGLAVLARLGLREQVEAAGAPIDRLIGRAVPSGRTILDVGYADLGADLHGLGIHRATLFQALYTAVNAAAVDLVADSAIEAVEIAAGDRPRLVDTAGRRHGPFDLTVLAAGAQTSLRAALGSQRAIRTFAYGALWSTVRLPPLGFEEGVLSQRYAAARKMVGVLPVGLVPGRDGKQAAFFWSIRADAIDDWRALGLAAWQDEVATLWPEAAGLLDQISSAAEMQAAFYVHYTTPSPVRGRVALIGDAAHSTSPQLGQGANMGLLDAYVLGEALQRSNGLEDALARYAQARKPHVRFYQRASYWLTPLFQSDWRLAAGLRDIAFPAMHAVPYFRRQTTRALAGLKTGLFTSAHPGKIEGFEP